jgi:hypothetical protein
MPPDPRDPTSGEAAANRRADRRTRVAVDGWENEGGRLSSPPRAPIAPSDISQAVSDPAAASGALAAMRASFLLDFAASTIGRHHEGHEPGSRVPPRTTD